MYVDPTLCTGCGECVEACPNGAIELRKGAAVIDWQLCTECQICIEACPTGAITSREIIHGEIIPAGQEALGTSVTMRPTQIEPARPAPRTGLATLAGGALAYLGKEVAPRVANVLLNALEYRLTHPAALDSPTSTTPASRSSPQSGPRRARQRRRRRGSP